MFITVFKKAIQLSYPETDQTISLRPPRIKNPIQYYRSTSTISPNWKLSFPFLQQHNIVRRRDRVISPYVWELNTVLTVLEVTNWMKQTLLKKNRSRSFLTIHSILFLAKQYSSMLFTTTKHSSPCWTTRTRFISSQQKRSLAK